MFGPASEETVTRFAQQYNGIKCVSQTLATTLVTAFMESELTATAKARCIEIVNTNVRIEGEGALATHTAKQVNTHFVEYLQGDLGASKVLLDIDACVVEKFRIIASTAR